MRYHLFCFVLALLGAVPVFSQTYVYTDREMLYDGEKEQMQLMVSANGTPHVWRWGRSRVEMDGYDARLHHQFSRVFSRRQERVFFIPFKTFYYAWIVGQKTSKLLLVKGDSCIDQTDKLADVPIIDGPVSRIEQGNRRIFFIQYNYQDSTRQGMMHITAIDDNLHYLNTVHLKMNYTPFQVRRLHIYTLDDQLLLMSTKVTETTSNLILHKIDVEQGTTRTSLVPLENMLFTPGPIMPFGTGFIVQGEARRAIDPGGKQTAANPEMSERKIFQPGTISFDNTLWTPEQVMATSSSVIEQDPSGRLSGYGVRQPPSTYLIHLDSGLRMKNSFYSGTGTPAAAGSPFFLYLPVSITELPGQELLTIDYRQPLGAGPKAAGAELRFTRLDSGLQTVKQIVQPMEDYRNSPSFVFAGKKEIQVYYQEAIKRNVVIVHAAQLRDSIENDRILQLRPKNNYQLRKAVRTGPSTFLMPYIRHYKLGLVSVRVPDGQDEPQYQP